MTIANTLRKTVLFQFRRVAHLFGYELVRTRRKLNRPVGEYQVVLPAATYSPWIADDAFNRAFSAVQSHTMVDRYRCYELWDLVAQAAKRPGAFIEVGVWRGGSGLLMAQRLTQLGFARTIYLCDTFRGLVKTGPTDYASDGMHSDTSAESVRRLASSLSLENVIVHEGIFPDDTADRIPEDKVAFCHVDVDVRRSAEDVIGWIWPRLVVGGIVVFDDYGFGGSIGLTKGVTGLTSLVNEMKMENDRVFVHNLNGHGILVKTR